MVYKLLRRIIAAGNYDAVSLLEKLDVYFMFGRISDAEYAELAGMLAPLDSEGVGSGF